MGKDASTIKQEIEQTRARMGDTVEAIGYKADVGSRVKEDVQARVNTVKSTIGDAVDNVKSAVNGAGETVSHAVSNATSSSSGDKSGAGSDGTNPVTSTVSRIGESAAAARRSVSDKLGDVDIAGGSSRAVDVVKENPLGLALAGLALGYLAGSLLPVSDVERERLGPVRDKVVDQANAVTHDLVEAGKAVVAETAHSVVTSALSSAQSHGKEVVDSAKTRAEQA